MKSHLFNIAALAVFLALMSWASSHLAAAPPDTEQKDLAALAAQVAQLQERMERLEKRVDELATPKMSPATEH